MKAPLGEIRGALRFIYLKPVMDPQLQTNASNLHDRISQIVRHL